MDNQFIHIIYNASIELKVKQAIDNVFENFQAFVKFNNYIASPVKIEVGIDQNAQFKVSKLFSELLMNQCFDHQKWFKEHPIIIEDDKKDYIGTCFYMINCLQEYAPNTLDHLGRFDFDCSYQSKFNCAEQNLVLAYFQEIALKIYGHKIPLKKSQFILTHDIDFIHSSWKAKLKHQIKTLELSKASKTLISYVKERDKWNNIEEILEDETNLEVPSIFFWMTQAGNTKFKGIKNADYDINEPYVQKCLAQIAQSNLHQSGLHKSISNLSFKEELAQLPSTQLNRYHYLKFNIPNDFKILSESKIKKDYSLGFSKNIGFRNSYGLPFKPFNPIEMCDYHFTAYPLHLMDSSLFYYMGCHTNEAMLDKLESFIKQHTHSSVISILWHNNFYEPQPYRKLLSLVKKHLDVYDK